MTNEVVPTGVDELAEYRSKTGRGEMCTLDHTGDTKIMWAHANEAEVEAARSTFNALKKKGYVAYAVKPGGDKGMVITEFDPTLEKLILAPPVVGG